MARRSLKPQLNQIRAWVRQGRTDAWIAHQLEVSTSELREFRKQHGFTPDEEDASSGDVDLRDEIEAEIEVYNEMMPTDASLSATLFIELPADVDARAELDKLIGLDEHVILHIGPHSIRAHFEPGRATEDRISAVQYTRYPLTAEARAALLVPGTKLAVEIDHPRYRVRVECSDELRASLAGDYA